MTFGISIYTKNLCDKSCSLYCCKVSAGIIYSGSFMYSYLFMGLFKYKLAMLAHMNFSFLTKITLLKIILSVAISAVNVVTSPGKLVRFPPTVSRVQRVSYFCGCISAIILS